MVDKYDIIVVGGGLAGLTAAIHAIKLSYSVLVIDNKGYPQHKVCGEYISNEVKPYWESLGIKVEKFGAVEIKEFVISDSSGKSQMSNLDLGGFGISRYKLDHELSKIILEKGGQLLIDKVIDIEYSNNEFRISTEKQKFKCRFCLGSFGKRSNIDKKLKRDFSRLRTPWIGIKAHYHYDHKDELVALHHFKGGYCGLSKVEDNKVNACYLVHQKVFDRYRGIEDVQRNILSQNPALKKFFSEAEMIFERPISISQIYFGRRAQIEDHVLMIGDSAGMIYPLAGNGMSMAIHSAKLSIESIDYYKGSDHSRQAIEERYQMLWNKTFSSRLRSGTIIQKIFENKVLSNAAMKAIQLFPSLLSLIIKKTHGEPIQNLHFTSIKQQHEFGL